MKVCLVIPPRVHGEWIGREDKHSGGGPVETLPYTAPLVYALLEREVPGIDLALVEAQRDGLDAAGACARIEAAAPDLVVAFLSWTHIPWDRVCAETAFPTIAVIVQQYVDQREAVEMYALKAPYVVKSEIEMPLVEGVREFQETGAIARTPGFLVAAPEGWIDTGDAPLADLTTFPLPNWTAFEPERYYALRSRNPLVPAAEVRQAHLNTMKGCPFRCAYCGQANRGEKVRSQSVAQVMAQLEFFVRELKVRSIVFFDNEFAVDVARAKAICRAICERQLGITFTVNNRVELFDDELIELLAAAGCDGVRLGIETCDPELQRAINKVIDLERAKEVIWTLHGARIPVHLYLTPGIPGETPAALRAMADFVVATEPATFSSARLVLTPGSPLYRQYKAEGRITEPDWSQLCRGDRFCFANPSYATIDDLRAAEQRMRRRAHWGLAVKRLKRGEFDGPNFARALLRTPVGRALHRMVTACPPLARFCRRVLCRGRRRETGGTFD